jgi:hypothetical protein
MQGGLFLEYSNLMIKYVFSVGIQCVDKQVRGVMWSSTDTPNGAKKKNGGDRLRRSEGSNRKDEAGMYYVVVQRRKTQTGRWTGNTYPYL